jgi:hypothetical protein
MYESLNRKLYGTRPFQRPRLKYYKIKIGVTEMWCKLVNWIHVMAACCEHSRVTELGVMF